MPFGVTYAVFVGAVWAALVFGKPTEEMKRRDVQSPNWSLTWGRNAPDKSAFGQDGVLTIEYRSDQELLFGLKPIYAIGSDFEGGAFVSVGLRKDFYFGRMQITPFFGPALYQSDLGDFSEGELLQLRTGIDLAYVASDRMRVSIGYFHMSNGQNNEHSAGIDVTRLAVSYRF